MCQICRPPIIMRLVAQYRETVSVGCVRTARRGYAPFRWRSFCFMEHDAPLWLPAVKYAARGGKTILKRGDAAP